MVTQSLPPPDPFGIEDALRAALHSGSLVVPPFPAVARQLQRAVNDPKSSARDLARIVSSDQALTGSVLRLANANTLIPVSSLRVAIARVGNDALVGLAMSAVLAESAGKKGPLSAVRVQVWRESVASALLARSLAPAYGLSRQEAFLCGLLHDVGRLVAVVSAEQVLARRDDLEALPADVWTLHLDHVHEAFGAEVARSWKLPSPILEAVCEHHQVSPAPPEEHGTPLAAAALVKQVDAVLALLAEYPSIEREQLDALEGLTAQAVDGLEHQVEELASEVSAVLGESRETKPRLQRKQPESWVAPSDVLGRQVREVALNATIRRNQGDVQAMAVAISPVGLRLMSPSRLEQGFLLRAHLQGNLDIEAHFTVETCEEQDDGYVAELKPFALSQTHRAQWLAVARGEAAKRRP